MLVAAALATAACASPSPTVQAQTSTVPLDVEFKVTDLDYKPIAGVPVRVAFGPGTAWQAPDNGTRFVTDASGLFRFTASATLEEQPKTKPTNWVDSLTAKAQPTDHLRVATELPWAGFNWVYVLDLWRFRSDGTVLTQGMSLYSRDEAGRFTREARRSADGWLIADLKGLVLSALGYDAWQNMLDPGDDPKSSHWTLKLAFKQSPPPVRR
jgi:hypothetical protein